MTERTRILTSDSVPVPLLFKEAYYGNGGCSTTPTYKYTNTYVDTMVSLHKKEITMVDHVIPDFHKRRNKGEVFFNPLLKTTVESVQTLLPRDCIITHRRRGCVPVKWYTTSYEVMEGSNSTLDWLSGGSVGTATPVVLDPGSLTEQAITEAWSNLDQAEILALVSLAEAEKTLDTIRSIMKSALKLIFTARHRGLKMVSDALRSKKSRKRLLKDLSNLYLEARYGLRPMYYDIVGASKAIKNFDSKRHDRLTVRGYRSTSDSSYGSLSNPFTWGYVTGSTTHTWNENRVVDIRAGCLAQVKLSWINDWGVGSLPSSAWELVPFSFIIDWFFNVGKIIGSWSPQPNTNVLGSWVTINSVATRSGTLTRTYQGGGTSSIKDEINVDTQQSSYQVTVTKQERIPHPSRPIIPSWNIRLDSLKLLDLGLIANNFRKEKSEVLTLERKFRSLRF